MNDLYIEQMIDAYHDAMDSKHEASVVGVSETWTCTCKGNVLCDECEKRGEELPF